MSRFINPFVDFGFKYIFGRDESKPFLIDFLNVLLADNPYHSEIIDITFLDKEDSRKRKDGRSVIYDIHCQTSDGRFFTVEMQNANQAYFNDRMVYYSSKAVSRQGRIGKDWKFSIAPVYVVAFMNFEIPACGGKFLTEVGLCDMQTGKTFSDKLRFYLLQLPKFDKKREEDCQTVLDQWIYNIKNMPYMERMAFTHQHQLFEHLEKMASYAALSEDDQRMYDNDLKAYQTIVGQLEYAEEKGRAEGMTESRIAIARRLLAKKNDVAFVASVTELSEEEVLALAEAEPTYNNSTENPQ